MAFLDESGLGKYTLNVKGMISLVQNMITSHSTDYNNPHGVDASDLGLEKVENKSSETIRNEITSENVTNALGYTPPTSDTTYSVVTESTDGLCPKLVNEEKQFLRSDGSWAEVPPSVAEIISETEPIGQEVGQYWIIEY